MNWKDKNKINFDFLVALVRSSYHGKMSDKVRQAYASIVESLLEQHKPHLNRHYYQETDKGIEPTSIGLKEYHKCLSAANNVVTPFSVYDDNRRFADHVLSCRASQEDRWEVLNEMLSLIANNGDVSVNYSEAQLSAMNYMGILYNYLLDRTQTGEAFKKQLAAQQSAPEEE